MRENRFDKYYAPGNEGAFTPPSGFATETLKLSGSSDIANADARLISIAGSCHVSGDARCEKFDVSGSLRVDGSVTAHTVLFRGSAEIGGNLRCMGADIKGSCSIAGSATASDCFEAQGSVSFGGSLECGELNAAGRLNAQSLRAGHVRIDGGGTIGAVTCTDAVINTGPENVPLLKLIWRRMKTVPELKIGTMVAEKNVTIGSCEVGELTTGNASLRKGCRIGVLKYRGTLDIDDDAVVERTVRID